MASVNELIVSWIKMAKKQKKSSLFLKLIFEKKVNFFRMVHTGMLKDIHPGLSGGWVSGLQVHNHDILWPNLQVGPCKNLSPVEFQEPPINIY